MSREPDARFRFDLAVFADTGEEPAAVYKHLDYLRSLSQPEILVRSAGKLGDDLIHGVNSTGQRFASIPAFTAEDHLVRPGSCEHRLPPAPKVGMVRRQCTSEYKIRVIEKAIRREVVGLKFRQRIAVGIAGRLHEAPGTPDRPGGGSADDALDGGGDSGEVKDGMPPLDRSPWYTFRFEADRIILGSTSMASRLAPGAIPRRWLLRSAQTLLLDWPI